MSSENERKRDRSPSIDPSTAHEVKVQDELSIGPTSQEPNTIKRRHIEDDKSHERRSTPLPDYAQVIDLEDEDDEDIPYTHSRSQSPLFLTSSDTEEVQLKKEKRPIKDLGDHSAPPTGTSVEDVINLDVDNEMQEYYIISDDEDNNDDGSSATQKTVNQQLEEKHESNSLLNTAHCAVCFESPSQTVFLPCGHIYCTDCVYKALSSMKTSTSHGGPCSLCRAYTSYKKTVVGLFKKKKKVLEGC